ncbi:diacylglycerol kinase iota-like [Ctenopharyngodon idella]|uniref:diacylglycerol kinase iota-like n=1 Tax=Ctenopharyngodon idella TaxID=7959 RepID=UPI00222ED416|nr:diacylglycerol kinase iota-like [Ctenopharyngodon idella]
MMDPLPDIRASQAERSSRGAAGGESADDQKRGCGRNAAMGGSDSLSSFADMEDSLEEKLKGLAFRKQISYRKAISRSGLQHLGPAQNPFPALSNGPAKELRNTVDWSENAVNGDHLWLETNCSGDLCYLGEETCLVKIAFGSL